MANIAYRKAFLEAFTGTMSKLAESDETKGEKGLRYARNATGAASAYALLNALSHHRMANMPEPARSRRNPFGLTRADNISARKGSLIAAPILAGLAVGSHLARNKMRADREAKDD